MLGKSWHLNTDPVNPRVTRGILWHEEHSGKRVGSHLKSVTKLHISWGWFVSLLTQEQCTQAPLDHKSWDQAGQSLRQEMALSTCHPPVWHHSVDHTCLLSKFAKQSLKYQCDTQNFSVSVLNTPLQGVVSTPWMLGKCPSRGSGHRGMAKSVGLHRRSHNKTRTQRLF